MKTWIFPLLMLCSVLAHGQITISATSNNPACNASNGAQTGEIDVTVTGGVAPFTYAWTTSSGQGLNPTSEDQTNLGAGTFHLVVTDSNGDTGELSYTLTEPIILSILASATDLDCAVESGNANGGVELVVHGGTPPYEYHWSTSDGAGLVQGQKHQWLLDQGTYVLRVTDANGCTQEDSYTLTAPDPVIVTGATTELDCNSLSGPPTGVIDITVSGGIGSGVSNDYTYQWTTTDGSGLAPTEDDQSGLGPGTYSVIVSDANGCTSDSYTWTFTEPSPVEITGESADSYCGDFNGLIDLSVMGGQGSSEHDYTYTWGTPDGCGLYHNSGYQPALCAGLYWVTVTDANGCDATAEFIIDGKESLKIETEIKDKDCEVGDATLTITAYEGQAPYTITWTSATGGDLTAGAAIIDTEGGSASYTGMEAYQEYSFTITDVSGCSEVFTFTPGVTVPYVLVSPSLCMVSADPMTGYNNILWEDPAVMDYITQYNIYREGSATGAYELVGSISADEENRFVDQNVDPTIQAYKYHLTAADECGLESPASNTHKTIHLVVNQGLNSNNNLEWDTYEGLNYDQVIIYRGTTAENMEELVSLPSTVGSFTDTNAPEGALVYQIAITQEIECEIGKALFSVRSNIAAIGESTGTQNLSFDVMIYPNPIANKLYINSEEKAIALLMNLNGQILIEKNIQQGKNFLNTENLEAGNYLLQLTNGAENYSQKVIKIK